MLNIPSGSLLPTKTKGKANGKRHCDHNTRKESLYECRCNLQLRKSCEDGEDPDRPARYIPEEIRRDKPSSLCGSGYYSLCSICNNCCNQEDQDRDNHLWQVPEDYCGEELSYRIELKHIECRYEEYDDYEPLNQVAKECAGRETEPSALNNTINTSGLERLINAECIDNLAHNATKTNADDPTDDEDEDRNY
jgi:hypothetical protein